MTEEVALQSRKSSTRLHNRPVRHTTRNSTTKLSKLSRTASQAQLHKLPDPRGDSHSTGSEASYKSEKPPITRSASVARIKSRNNSAHRTKLQGQNGHPTGQHKIIHIGGLEDPDEKGASEFSDTDTEDDSKSRSSRASFQNSSTLSLGIHPVEPTPAQISNETVVSVTSMADMANALSVRRPDSVFVTDGDLLSKAASKSQSVADLQKIVGSSSSRINNRMRLKQQMPHEIHANGAETVPGQDKRIFEKIFRCYINSKATGNPVLESMRRVMATTHQDTRKSPQADDRRLSLGLRSKKAIGSLSATTYNQMADLILDDREAIFGNAAPASHIYGLSSYLLQKMWTQGWNPQDSDSDQDAGLSVQSAAAQARKANARSQEGHPTQKQQLPQKISAPQPAAASAKPSAFSSSAVASASSASSASIAAQQAKMRANPAPRRARPAAPDAIRLA